MSVDDHENSQIILAHERTDLAVERTLLAAERTFSAWIRTGLAGVGGGILLIKAITYHHWMHKVLATLTGDLLIIWGVSMFLFALYRYLRVTKKLGVIKRFSKPISFGAILMVSSLVLAALISILIIHTA